MCLIENEKIIVQSEYFFGIISKLENSLYIVLYPIKTLPPSKGHCKLLDQ